MTDSPLAVILAQEVVFPLLCFLDLEDAYGRNDHSVSELVSGFC